MSSSEAIASPDPSLPLDLRVGDEPIPFSIMAAFALPGEQVPITIASADTGLDVSASAGALLADGANHWTWSAPVTPGAYRIRAARADGSGEIMVNAFVMVPYSEMRHGVLDGYRIGDYPQHWNQHGATFDRPLGFVEVNAATETLRVSPHFTLEQFVCKEGGDRSPKFLTLKPTLLVKLEDLLAIANRHGVEAGTFHLMSAYRTPVYNRGIGNPTTFSRHQYGDAADIFVDANPADGVMDDLNHDGRTTRADAQLLASWADEIDGSYGGESLVGGLSAYAPTSGHGPFVHMDARGYAARW
jgi:hypothetical protein